MSVEFDVKKLDWQEARDKYKADRAEGKRELPPEDNYLCKVVRVEAQKSAAGNLMLNVEFRIICSLTRRDAGDDGATEHRNIPFWSRFMLHGGGVWRTRELEVAVGCDDEGDLDELVQKLDEATVRVTAEKEVSEGYPDKLVAKKVLPPTDEDTTFAVANPHSDDFNVDRF